MIDTSMRISGSAASCVCPRPETEGVIDGDKPNILVIWGDDIAGERQRLQPRDDGLPHATSTASS